MAGGTLSRRTFLCPQLDFSLDFPCFPVPLQYTNRCLLKWLKLWDTVVFGKDKAAKKPRPGPAAHPTLSHPKENSSKWKTKVQLTEEILEAELDQHKRPKYKVSRRGHGPGSLCCHQLWSSIVPSLGDTSRVTSPLCHRWPCSVAPLGWARPRWPTSSPGTRGTTPWR